MNQDEQSWTFASTQDIYKVFYDLKSEKNYEECDRILYGQDVTELESYTLLAFLQATVHIKDKLMSYESFYLRVRTELANRMVAERVERNLEGLEP